MKFLRLPVLISVLLAASGSALAAPIRIGVLLKGKNEFWMAVEKGVNQGAAKTGAEVIIKSPMYETDVAVQLRLLSALADQNIQALVIAPCSDSLAGPVEALAAKGVKIVVIDSPLGGNLESTFVGTDQRAAGKAAGTLLNSVLSDGDEVAFLRNTQGKGAANVRENGALGKLMSAHPLIVVHGDIYASSEAGQEEERCELLLTKYPQVKAIFASGTPGTMAMLKVLTAKKAAGSIKFVGCGFNLNAAVVAGLQDGTMTGWVAQLPEDTGSKGVESAVALVNGQMIPQTISTEFLVITKDKLSDPKVQRLLSL
jgi:ribose transport system substrate-binding protein